MKDSGVIQTSFLSVRQVTLNTLGNALLSSPTCLQNQNQSMPKKEGNNPTGKLLAKPGPLLLDLDFCHRNGKLSFAGLRFILLTH